MIKVTGRFQFNKRKLEAFAKKVNGLPKVVEKTNSVLLGDLSAEIRQVLANDPRPSFFKPRWIGHEYTGSLISSVKHNSKSAVAGGKATISSQIGYTVPHGTNIEPPATVRDNIFVPVGWSNDWSANLHGRFKPTHEGVFPENLSESKLYKWALHLLMFRDLDRGKKSQNPDAVRKRAKRLSKKFYESLQGGTYGYPIITPLFEKHVQEGWFDKIFSAAQNHLGMDVPF